MQRWPPNDPQLWAVSIFSLAVCKKKSDSDRKQEPCVTVASPSVTRGRAADSMDGVRGGYFRAKKKPTASERAPHLTKLSIGSCNVS